MKKDDKDLEQFLAREKAYYQHQRSQRTQINISRSIPNNSANQDNQFPNHILTKPENNTQAALLQQKYIKNIQDGVKSPLEQNNGASPMINILELRQSLQTNNMVDGNIKQRKGVQPFNFNQQKDGQSTNFHKISKSVSSSQTDINNQIKIEFPNADKAHVQSANDFIIQDKQLEEYNILTPAHRELISRNSSLILPKSSQGRKEKYINSDSYNIFTATAASFKTKRNSMSNTQFLTPLQTRTQTPNSTQIFPKNDNSMEANEVLKSQSNLSKALNSLGISSQLDKDKKQYTNSRSALKKITQNDSSVIKQQLNNSLLQSKLTSQSRIPISLLDDKKIQLESSILTGRIQNLHYSFQEDKLINLYSNSKQSTDHGTEKYQFIQFTNDTENAKSNQKDQTKPILSNASLCVSPSKVSTSNQFFSKQNSPKAFNVQQNPFETNINAIKAKLQMQLLELISCDAYLSNQAEIEQEDDSYKHENWKFKKLQLPKEGYYQKKFDKISIDIIKNRENNQQQQNKLFSILQNKDQIVIHTSQNKDLMYLSERKDVISLAQWYEDMLNQIYNNQQKLSSSNQIIEDSYSRLFEDLQVVHQACISEIIRQISIQSVERGQLLKKVQENLMTLIREGFSKQLEEKVQFQKDVHREIQSVHRDCIEKIDYYIPLISNLTNANESKKNIDLCYLQLNRKDALNKRILLEFRYLKKKNHKLEKFLKEGRKEYKNLQQDYNKLKRQLDDLNKLHVQTSTRQIEDQQKMADLFVKQLEQITNENQQKQEFQADKMKKQKKILSELQQKYENDQKEIQHQYKINQQEIDEIEDLAQKEEFVNNDFIQERSERQIQSVQQLQSSERQIIEIEALDGLRFVLASVGVQVENDLILRQDAETETRTHFTTNEIDTQTEKAIPKVVLTQQCQTPQEWIKIHDSLYEQDTKNMKQNQSLLYIKEDSIFLKKVQSQVSTADKSLLKIDFTDKMFSDSPVNKYMSTPESSNKFNIFMEAISDDKMEFKSSDTDLNEQEEYMLSNTNRNTDESPVNKIKEKPEEKNQSTKFKQTLENTLKASIDDDISDLHLILYSKQRFVLDVFKKIIDYNLLKDNPYLKYDELKLFIEDSQAFKQEENLRFRNIYNKCKLQLIEYVKSKISLSEKEVEIEEANKNLDFGQILFIFVLSLLNFKQNSNTLYEKLINEYENVLEQISSNSIKINTAKKSSNGGMNPISNSINSIILETEDIDQEHDTTTKSKKKEDNNTLQKPLMKEDTLKDLKKQSSSVKKNKSRQSSVSKSSNVSQPSGKKQASTSPQKRIQSQDSKIDQKGITQIKIFNDEDLLGDEDIESEHFSPEPKQKGKQKFSKIVSMVIFNKSKRDSKIGQQQKVEQPETISDDIISKQIIQQKSQVVDLFKNYRFKKHKLRKKYGLQSSPNQDAAFNFLQNVGYKIMNTASKKNKGAVFTEQNTRKYISLIYNDKIKQIKSSDNSNPLHNVAYDFFLNKFGFKKLAEKNLLQFLRSLQYHNHIERVKMFLRFYGIDHEINYDIDDFNFYINSTIHLDDNLSPQFQSFSIYSIPKVIELLFKKFENKITLKIINRIKSDIESMKYLTSESSLKNKQIIDQDQALQCLLQAKIEEKKVNIIALRPIYLAGDVDNDQVIGIFWFNLEQRIYLLAFNPFLYKDIKFKICLKIVQFHAILMII